MSITSDDQYVFGSRVANVGGSRAASTRSRTGAQTTPAVREVAPGDELITLCGWVAAAMPSAARTAVVLVAPPRRPSQAEGLTPTSVATSSPATTAVLRIEWLLQEGPVRTSLESGETTVSGRLGADGRWPRYARAVPAHDAVSAAAVPLPLTTGVGSGVLAAYSQDVGAFDPRDLRVLTAFARVVADVVARKMLVGPAAETQDPETQDPETQDPETDRLVNQAVGVLITRHCDEQQARRRLARISESSGQPLAAAARMIVNEAQVEAHLRFVVRSPHQRVQPEPDR